MNFLGIDLGTSEVKLVLLSDRHEVLGQTGEPLSVQRPQALWSEQNPDDWWQATCTAMDRLSASHASAMAQVGGIGLSGQMHGAVVLDASDAVLRPAILWNDGRSSAECAELTRRVPDLATITGNLAMPGFTAPKLLWLQRHEPHLFARIRTVLLPKDWLRLQLTGEKAGDMSDAAGTLWLDVAARNWSDTMLDACGLSREHMPPLLEGSAPAGYLHAALARRWGMPGQPVVAAGGGDNAASAVGIGAVRPGGGFLSLGTSGVLFVATDRHRPNPASAVHAFCHALPNGWHQMSVMLSAASCLRWATQLAGATNEATLLAGLDTLDATQRARAPVFLPYLSGERTPHNDANATGALVALTHDHGPAQLAYAVLEGVGFGLLDGLEALRQAGTSVQQLSLVGGGARSAAWSQLLATILGLRLCTHADGAAGGGLGAARLAWLACGGAQDAVCTPPPIDLIYEPDTALAAQLDARYRRFRALYGALREDRAAATATASGNPS